ncbi:hypothetical protein KM043_007069 [Ampulex compressa]|nr:hypothetical protein KM043_007069 [Ampulex compressa]
MKGRGEGKSEMQSLTLSGFREAGSRLDGVEKQVEIASARRRPRSAPDMHSLVMACVGLVPRPMPEPGLENAGVVGRAGIRVPGTMPRRRARTGCSYSLFRATMPCHDCGQGWNQPNRGP